MVLIFKKYGGVKKNYFFGKSYAQASPMDQYFYKYFSWGGL